jgi:hypothetical protein
MSTANEPSPKKTPPKKKPTSGRVTQKGTRPGGGGGGGDGQPAASSRYTPPVPLSAKMTAPWVVPVMFVLLGLGLLMILLNYMDLLPGGTSNWYLIGGLGLILGGIITATQLH